MKSKVKLEILIGVIFIYISTFLINYLVKSIPNLHFGKDGGIVTIAILHCISGYLFFIILQRSLFTYIGMGLFVGLASCLFILVLTDNFKFKIDDWFKYVLLLQIIASTFEVMFGIIYKILIHKIILTFNER